MAVGGQQAPGVDGRGVVQSAEVGQILREGQTPTGITNRSQHKPIMREERNWRAMTTKAKRDEEKRHAKMELKCGSDPADLGNYAVSFQAAKIAERDARLSIKRAIRREERRRRSIARRAESARKAIAEALVHA